MERAFARIVAGLGDAVTIDLGGLAGAFSVTTTAAAPFEPATFAALATAVLHRRRVELDYDSVSGRRRRRAVDPYHLAQIDGQWYLVGHCYERGAVRMFAPGRIRAITVTEESFAPPAGFRIDEYLGRSLGVLRGVDGEVHRVRLRFTGAAARYVEERTWHPSQAIEKPSEGVLVLTLELSHLREVERWALSWGAECEVLEPAAAHYHRPARRSRHAPRS